MTQGNFHWSVFNWMTRHTHVGSSNSRWRTHTDGGTSFFSMPRQRTISFLMFSKSANLRTMGEKDLGGGDTPRTSNRKIWSSVIKPEIYFPPKENRTRRIIRDTCHSHLLLWRLRDQQGLINWAMKRRARVIGWIKSESTPAQSEFSECSVHHCEYGARISRRTLGSRDC